MFIFTKISLQTKLIFFNLANQRRLNSKRLTLSQKRFSVVTINGQQYKNPPYIALINCILNCLRWSSSLSVRHIVHQNGWAMSEVCSMVSESLPISLFFPLLPFVWNKNCLALCLGKFQAIDNLTNKTFKINKQKTLLQLMVSNQIVRLESWTQEFLELEYLSSRSFKI